MSILQQNPNFHMFMPGWKGRGAKFLPSDIDGLELWLRGDKDIKTKKASGARQFTSANSEHFLLADNADLSTGDIDFTWCGWFIADSFPTSARVVSKRSAANEMDYDIQVESGVLNFHIGNNSGNVTETASSFGALSTNLWYFYWCEHDATANTLRMSVNDGTKDSVTTGAITPEDSTATFMMGNLQQVARFWDGRMDSTAFWKRTLTDAEITWLYNNGAGRKYADVGQAGDDGSNLKTSLTAWWDLAEASGDATDAHGSNTLSDQNTVTSGASVIEIDPSDGNTISRIEDQSSNSRDFIQGEESIRPTYETNEVNGKSVMRFDGTNDQLTDTDGYVATGELTLFVVQKCTSYASSRQINGDWNTSNFGIIHVNANNLRFKTTTSVDINHGLGFSTSAFQVLTITRDSSDLVRIFKNNSEGAATGTKAGNIEWTAIGAQNTTRLNPFVGDMAEIIVYNTELSAFNRTKVYNYLKSKYGL